MLKSKSFAVLLAAGVVLSASSGVADAAAPARDAVRAQEHYEKGQAHFMKGEYDQAIAELVRAISYDRQPVYLWNIARAHEKKGDYANARNFYSQYRDAATTTEDRADADAKLLALERLEAARRSVGRLVLKCNVDGARVRVDGHDKGVTPVDELMELTIGEHTVSLTRDGYRPLSTTVTIEGALTKTVHVELVPLDVHVTGELQLVVRDVGALARLDGAEVGTGPFERVISVGVGRHELTIQLDGRLPYIRSIEIIEGQRLRLAPQLAKVPEVVVKDNTALRTWGFVLVGVGVVTAGVGAYYLVEPPVETTRGDGLTVVQEDLTPGTVVTTIGGVALGAGILLLVLAADDEPATTTSVTPGHQLRGAPLVFTF